MTGASVSPPKPVPQHATLPRWRTLAALGIAGWAYVAIRDWSANHVFMINATDSLPNWAFLVERHVMPTRGQYVFFRVPATPLIRAHFGDDPQPFGKLVYGVSGDLVARAGNIVAVNGAPVAVLKPVSKRGEPLTPGPLGRVPDNCYFVATPHKDGFDSRYADIGWVCARQIVGTGVPVL
ncbi:S26 family signal peptidase [Sphingomonas sp. SUN039]|uniref:S26 family signal peptidase n=1 Tax=Sphingomonas sp. SUN039 TaxID=2937787 RepID=UPI002164E56C|nr:S26 family signal peptidase [Sphingomonas sp. SUN039]UVO53794.1 S26 family signal peptidase [Sphingomonas sp. SUN039]